MSSPQPSGRKMENVGADGEWRAEGGREKSEGGVEEGCGAAPSRDSTGNERRERAKRAQVISPKSRLLSARD